MIGFRWHIVTSVVLLFVLSGAFSQSRDSLDVNASLQTADTIEFRHQETLDSLRQSTLQSYDSFKRAHNSVISTAETAAQPLRNEIDDLTETSLPSFEILSSEQVPGIDVTSGNVGDLVEPLAPVKQQGTDVIPVIPPDAESAATVIESKATGAVEATGVTGQLDEAGAINPLPATPGDPQAVKKELIEDGKKMAVNHFAGKEEQLQQAMDRLSAYKKKYHSFESVLDLPKKAPNAMRGKPFIERLVPGLALQIGRTDHWLLDVNPYLGYRFTGRITAGAGWNHRFAYNTDANAFSSGPAIYGPRAYGEYSVGKGFSGRLELEYMNTYVPALFASNPDNPDNREWVFGVMTGMKKEYRITRRLKGTALLLYNLYDPHHRSPYRNRLNGRFGVEWSIKGGSK